MVAHDVNFDHGFMIAAAERASLKRKSFHPFRHLRRCCAGRSGTRTNRIVKGLQTAGMDFDNTQAHSALYDAERTAVLFVKSSTAGNV
ncbi:exonuclease domain-containing protein [Shigella boydii]